jgi:hypothetical protein
MLWIEPDLSASGIPLIDRLKATRQTRNIENIVDKDAAQET